MSKYAGHEFKGRHIFGSRGGHPHCIFCGMWRGDDVLPEKCTGPIPDTKRGLYRKYEVTRLNDPDGTHANCEYYVLDLAHDKFAVDALEAYAAACRDEFPALSRDLYAKLKTVRAHVPAVKGNAATPLPAHVDRCSNKYCWCNTLPAGNLKPDGLTSSKLHAWIQSLDKGERRCRESGDAGDAQTLRDIAIYFVTLRD